MLALRGRTTWPISQGFILLLFYNHLWKIICKCWSTTDGYNCPCLLIPDVYCELFSDNFCIFSALCLLLVKSLRFNDQQNWDGGVFTLSYISCDKKMVLSYLEGERSTYWENWAWENPSKLFFNLPTYNCGALNQI